MTVAGILLIIAGVIIIGKLNGNGNGKNKD